MQLTIIKWTMVVPILLKILCVQADDRSSSNACLKSESNLPHHFHDKSLVENSRHKKNGRSLDRRKIHRRMTAIHGSIQDLDRERLAEKLAKEALKSPEVQDTIRKLSNVKGKKNPLEVVRVPATRRAIKGHGRVGNSQRHRKRRKKKRRKHRQKVPSEAIRKEGVGIEGGAPKHTLGARKHVHADSEPEIVKYNDSSSKSKSEGGGVKGAKSESDPNALNADVLRDILANRIQIKLREPENRYVRETLDNTSLYRGDSIAGNADEFSPDFQLDDPLSGDNVGGITTEQILLTDITGQHFDPVTVAEVSTSNLDLSSEEKFSNDIPGGSLPELNNPITDTKLQSKLKNRMLLSRHNKKIGELAKELSHISTESFALDTYDPLFQKDYEPPPIHLPNPMDQPLGKVLESLGINVNANLRQKEQSASAIAAHSPKRISSSSHVLPVGKVSINTPSFEETETLPTENYAERNSEKPDPDAIQVFNDDSYNQEEKESVDVTTDSYQRTRFTKPSERPYRNQTVKPLVIQKTSSNSGSQSDSVSGRQTKVVAHEILDEIMSELHGMKPDHPKSSNEGSPCRLTGSWLTSQAGLRFDMSVSNRTISVGVSKSRVKPALLEIPVNSTWNVSGHAPFKVGAPFTLLATNNSTKSIAVFVGSCRVCQGVDTIAGVWSVAHQPTDCQDFHISTSIFSDLFRRIRQPFHATATQASTESRSTSTQRSKSTDSSHTSNDGAKD